MFRKEVNAQSPLRILERSTHGGLGPGKLGVVMARAGVGKTAFLVQIGLDEGLRGRDVLHIALGQSLDHAQSWYDGLFDDLARDAGLDDRETVRANLNRRRVIQAYPEVSVDAPRIEKAVELYRTHLELKPGVILVDGYDWSESDIVGRSADIGALKALARRLEAELWMSAQTHRSTTGPHPTRVPAPCAAYESIINVGLFLEPKGHLVSVRLLKDHDNAVVDNTHLELEPDTLQLVRHDQPVQPAELPPRAYTLLSGGAKGTECAFGEFAEEWGLTEINYSFAGRPTARNRGVVELQDEELKQGEVSSAYLETQLRRQFPRTPQFRKMLHTIWHQVATSGQVFVVGVILEDATVNGGTGWAAELAKHLGKPVHVFDQEKRRWFTWNQGRWADEAAPRISRTRFTGTGTRFLSDDGRAAIRSLFEFSFGQPGSRPGAT